MHINNATYDKRILSRLLRAPEEHNMRGNMKCHLAMSRHDLTSIPCYRRVNRQHKNKQLEDFSAAKKVNKGAERIFFPPG